MKPAVIEAPAARHPGAPARPVAEAALLSGPAATEAMLCGALLESRQRWRDIAGLAADLVFESDAAGRLAFLAPDPALGWESSRLLGQPLGRLLLRPEPDPFALRTPVRGLRAWLRHADGRPACLAFNLVPLRDAAGGFAGLRGAALDVTAEMEEAEAQATSLRRATARDRLLHRLGHRTQAPHQLAAAVAALLPGLGCTGAAVLELPPAGGPQVLQCHGGDPALFLPPAEALASAQAPLFWAGPGGERLALLPQPHHAGPRHALLAWRTPDGREFDADERHLLAALAELVFLNLGNHARQRDLELQARTEPLTGLLNRRAFLADLRRRLDRLARLPAGHGQPGGALLFIDLDRFKPVNDLLGHDAGDAALVAIAGLLRDKVRPSDLVARLGGDEFALWLEGADSCTASTRAQALCRAAPALLPELAPALRQHGAEAPTLSIGCALHHGPAETPEALLARADAAMYVAKRAGRNRWAMAAQPGAA